MATPLLRASGSQVRDTGNAWAWVVQSNHMLWGMWPPVTNKGGNEDKGVHP